MAWYDAFRGVPLVGEGIEGYEGGKLKDAGNAERQKALQNMRNSLPTEQQFNDILGSQDPLQLGQADSGAIDAQRNALAQLQSLAGGGLLAGDRSAIREIQNTSEANERAQREALMAQAQQRGMGGSGSQLAAALSNQQGGATRAASQANAVQTAAMNRALQALQGQGQVAGQMRGQSFGESNTNANAMNERSRYNTDQRLGFQRDDFERKQRVNETQYGKGQSDYQQGTDAQQKAAESVRKTVVDTVGAIAGKPPSGSGDEDYLKS